jgi:hypothetical protein
LVFAKRRKNTIQLTPAIATGVEAVEKLQKIHFSSRIYAINPVK